MSVPASALVTDLYQLTMMQGYLKSGLADEDACFDLFFRKNPFGGGYAIFAGVSEALAFLSTMKFSDDDISYLRSLKIFTPDFLDYLKRFKFTGDVFAADEGTAVFPMEPVLRVVAPLYQAQLVETALLNVINFQSLVATKSARICQSAGEDNVIEFGLRRAQGVDGGLTASRAAYIGGCVATSNVQAGMVYGIPVRGTHAHSWVSAFENELTAFRKFVEYYPSNPILLVDTYDTLASGVPNAIKVGLEMKGRGQNLYGVRLDSGDLAFLSIETRKALDGAGLTGVKIVGSNELDENIIHDLKTQGAKIDLFGVGTKLVTADGEPAMSGVYKMSAIRSPGGEWRMKMKISDGLDKSTLPGVKQVWRLRDSKGETMADLVEMDESPPDFSKGVWGFHPTIVYHKKFYDGIAEARPLLSQVMRGGNVMMEQEPLSLIRDRVKRELASLHPTTRRLLNPHIYKVSVGPKLKDATAKLRGSWGDSFL